jgi:choline dehydrogenase-like flavoprotein
MLNDEIKRREFIKTLVAGVSTLALDWSVLPRGIHAQKSENEFDAVIIGSGLGGLSCAAAFARQGFRPLVLEKHDRPGGYATTFTRPGGFVFDASLHSTTVGDRRGIHNLIPGFPEIDDVEFVPHPHLTAPSFRIMIFACRKKSSGLPRLARRPFPGRKAGIEALFADMRAWPLTSENFQALMGKST